MVLKSIRDMVPRPIATRSSPEASPVYIASRSAPSKKWWPPENPRCFPRNPAFDKKPHRNQTRGRYCEELVEKELIQSGYQILARNWRTPFAEVDIVAIQNNLVLFVEVKSLSGDGWASMRLQSKQLMRLRSALMWVQGQIIEPCKLELHLVQIHTNQIHRVDLI